MRRPAQGEAEEQSNLRVRLGRAVKDVGGEHAIRLDELRIVQQLERLQRRVRDLSPYGAGVAIRKIEELQLRRQRIPFDEGIETSAVKVVWSERLGRRIAVVGDALIPDAFRLIRIDAWATDLLHHGGFDAHRARPSLRARRHQHAAEADQRPGHVGRRRQVQSIAVRRRGQRLRRGVVHHLRLLGKEIGLLDRAPRLRRPQLELQARPALGRLERPSRGHGGQLLARLGEDRRQGGDRARRAGRDGERHLQLRSAGEALLAALQPIGPSGQRHGLSGRQRRPRRDPDREQHVPLVAVAGHGSLRKGLGIRPLDGRGLEAVRQLPREPRGQARVPRVLPVGVPARLHPQVEPQPERLAGLDGLDLGDELGLDVA